MFIVRTCISNNGSSSTLIYCLRIAFTCVIFFCTIICVHKLMLKSRRFQLYTKFCVHYFIAAISKCKWWQQHCQVNNNNYVVNCNRQQFRLNRWNNYYDLVTRVIRRKTTAVETNILYGVVIRNNIVLYKDFYLYIHFFSLGFDFSWVENKQD